ncbi:unnamed protein product [Auanema sp. JU1783]|nr:unnamed protein product [Auanema sp. JU1783]
MIKYLLFAFSLFYISSSQDDFISPAVRVARLQINYDNANPKEIEKVEKWNSIMRNSVLASLKFINKHWLICGGERSSNDCGKAQVTGESIGPVNYRINVTFIAERDPIKNAKVEATSTVSAVTQIGLKGGIFQYTNALKVLGKPSSILSFDEAFFCYKGATLIDGDKCRPCSPGHYFREDECHSCGEGEFQPEAGQVFCHRCATSTTSTKGTAKASDCFTICPSGFFYDSISKFCEPCSFRGFQPDAGKNRCLSCPPGTVPLYLNSTSIDHCLENCPTGFQRSSDGQKCVSCPIGSFKSSTDSVCMLCPPGQTTIEEGSKSMEDCSIKTCYPGTFWNSTSLQCAACPYGTYEDEYDSRLCKTCPAGTTTYQTGTNSVLQCLLTNQCKSGKHGCHWLAACMDLPDEGNKPRYSCKCKPGYVGNGYTCSDICAGFCKNGSTCLKTGRGEVKCVCSSGTTGRRCEKRIA